MECLTSKRNFRKERGYDTVVVLEGFDIKLVLFIDPTHPARSTNPENLGVRNFVLHVDDLETTIEEIKKNAEESKLSIEFGPIMKDWQDSRFVFFKDPDGLPVGLHE
ncbi:MAG: VOC family protein [Lachnospiraceae bacterium]|nr:VOC family protein [Lachnospiraceae bacterium]